MHALFPSTRGYNIPPAKDELEVSVIGPGYGECALVHFGDGNWLLVDSCVHADYSEPAPLRYLNDIGVPPDGVRLLGITHWDDDHCKGIAQLVRACPQAQVTMATAFVEKDFLAFVRVYSSPLTKNARAGVKEIKEVAEELFRTGRTVTAAGPARRLLCQNDISLSHGLPFEIWTLSPSDQEHQNFLAWVAKQIPRVGETRRVAVSRLRNDLSVVLHITVGADAILLGGDLEEEGNPNTGWSAVISLNGRPNMKAGVFKVPHHGSLTGHHNAVPASLLANEPIAVVAPFRNGSVSLPKRTDVTRIIGYAPQSYATTDLKGTATPRRLSTVDKTIKEVTARFSTLKRQPGMIRLRKRAGATSPWKVEEFGAAVPLAKI